MTEKKMVITEPIDSYGIELLKREANVVYLPELPDRSLAEEIKDAHAIIVRVVRLDSTLIEPCRNLLVIAKHGVGYDNIDVAAATRKKIPVINAPEANIESVAEHNIGLMLSLAKNICTTNRALRHDTFRRREDYPCVELAGKKLGIIGLGRTGVRTADKCQRAFNMKIMAYSPTSPAERFTQLGCARVEKLDDLLGEADFIVLCVPLTLKTASMIGARELGMMKSQAFLINSSRGGVVDEDALYHALCEGKIAGAAMDVFAKEPATSANPLLSLDNFIATPHVAGSTAESMRRVAISVAEDILSIFAGKMPRYPVNPEVYRK
ncbi:MAG: hydroxyacid dehydrogenase [Chloroflexota bacterium]